MQAGTQHETGCRRRQAHDNQPLTRVGHLPIVVPVNGTHGRVNQDDLKALESKIDQLIAVCDQLKKENESLRSEQNRLNDQHTKLVEKTKIARERIESMIGRLKTLERT